jgi:uncharacterized protein involved in tolerance to divalent cations
MKRPRFSTVAALVAAAGDSYDVPEILAVPVIEGSRDYLTWMQEELDSGK